MKKTFICSVTALLPILLLLAGAIFPVCAEEQPEIEPTWQNVIESVVPRGDEPWVSLDLMPYGYNFTDYSIPKEYEVTLKDQTTVRARIPTKEVLDIFYDGVCIGNYFDVDAGDEVMTLCAYIYFDEKTKQSEFMIGQVVTVPEEYEGELYYQDYFFLISSEPCRTEIDDGSFLARMLYPIYSVFERIIQFFTKLKYKLGL